MGKNCRLIFICLGSICVITQLISCYPKTRTENFYCDSKAEMDVWRIPIIEPIELITADHDLMEWGFSTYPYSELKNRSYSVDSVQYQERKILLYSKINGYIVIDLVNNKDEKFDSYSQFYNYTIEKNLSQKLYYVPSLYNSWIRSKKLPWEQELGFNVKCDN